MLSNILVIGSMNMDFVVSTKYIPKKGETINGLGFELNPGGKGANQALAAAKLGGSVSFIGACGKDYFGDKLLANLKEGGIKTDNIIRTDKSTGIAAITVEEDGDNRIIIIEGANGLITPKIIDEFIENIKNAKLILLQMEIPLATIIHIVNLANKYGTTIILDPAPAHKLPVNIMGKIDYLLPNETELRTLVANNRYRTQAQKAKRLLELGVKTVIVTMGDKGICLYKKEECKEFKTTKVSAVDTTAAGDAFAGALAVGLENNWSLEKAIKYAVVVGTFSVTRLGAQKSLPEKEQVNEFIIDKGFENLII